MVLAFSQVYAHEVKGADAVVLGAMAAAAAAGSIVLAVPLGRLADRIGRKRVLYLTIPLFCLSCLVLVWAPGPAAFLVAAGALQSFFYIGGPIAAAMERELVPGGTDGPLDRHRPGREDAGRRGRSSSSRAPSGTGVGPEYVFLAFVAIDLGIRLPLLVTMPETLRIRFAPQPVPLAD